MPWTKQEMMRSQRGPQALSAEVEEAIDASRTAIRKARQLVRWSEQRHRERRQPRGGIWVSGRFPEPSQTRKGCKGCGRWLTRAEPVQANGMSRPEFGPILKPVGTGARTTGTR